MEIRVIVHLRAVALTKAQTNQTCIPRDCDGDRAPAVARIPGDSAILHESGADDSHDHRSAAAIHSLTARSPRQPFFGFNGVVQIGLLITAPHLSDTGGLSAFNHSFVVSALVIRAPA